MSCLLTQGFLDDCKEALGGIKEIFVGNWGDFDTGITFDNSTGEIDGLPTATLYRYKLARSSSSWQEVATINETNRTRFYAQTVTAVLGRMSAAKRKELMNASAANPIVFVRDSMDNIWCVGRLEGTTFNTTAQSGTAKGDLNGYNIEIVAEERFAAERLESFTTTPFDNFAGITVSPGYNS
jgi:hypothetical protein